MEITKFTLGPIDSNCYVVKNNGDITVIDPGYPSDKLFSFLENEKNVKYILLTHRHIDHHMGAKKLKELTGAKIAIHRLDECGLYSADDSLYSSLSQYYNIPQPNLDADILLGDGDELDFGSGKIKVMHTPGHSAGGVCFIIEDVIFSGDTLFYENIGRLDFPTGSVEDIKNSLNKLTELKDDYKVMSGHGEDTTLQHERENNPYLGNEKWFF